MDLSVMAREGLIGPEWFARIDVEHANIDLLPTHLLNIDAQAMKALADASIEGYPIETTLLAKS